MNSFDEKDHSDQRKQLQELLDRIDKNHDRVISMDELNKCILSGDVKGREAIWIGLLKLHFDSIKKSEVPHFLRWFSHGVPAQTVFQYAARHNLFESDYSHYLDTPRSLFADRWDALRSIRPEAVLQGAVGNCYFLAGVASLAKINPSMIKRMIQSTGETYTVTFPGALDEPIEVSPPTDAELFLYAHATEFGVWVAVLEKAFGIYLRNHGEGKSIIAEENTDGGLVHHALDLLTGQQGQWQSLARSTSDEIAELLTNAFREKRIVVAATGGTCDEHLNALQIPQAHAYSVLEWNANKHTLLLRNPWGGREHSEPISAAGIDVEDEQLDGIFRISLGAFMMHFEELYFEQWLADDRYVDGARLPARAIIRRLDEP